MLRRPPNLSLLGRSCGPLHGLVRQLPGCGLLGVGARWRVAAGDHGCLGESTPLLLGSVPETFGTAVGEGLRLLEHEGDGQCYSLFFSALKTQNPRLLRTIELPHFQPRL